MPNIEVNIEIYCSCGEGLCGQTRGEFDSKGNPSFVVSPCLKCFTRAQDDGYEEGYEQGIEKARNAD